MLFLLVVKFLQYSGADSPIIYTHSFGRCYPLHIPPGIVSPMRKSIMIKMVQNMNFQTEIKTTVLQFILGAVQPIKYHDYPRLHGEYLFLSSFPYALILISMYHRWLLSLFLARSRFCFTHAWHVTDGGRTVYDVVSNK